MKKLADIIDLLRPKGRYMSFQYDDSEDVEFYAVHQLDERGRSTHIGSFIPDDDAQRVIDKCGDCPDLSEGPEDRLAYGPYCSTYSHVDNIDRNRQLIDDRLQGNLATSIEPSPW